MKNRSVFSILLTLVLILFSVAGCGAEVSNGSVSSPPTAGMDYGYADKEAVSPQLPSGGNSVVSTQQKLIRTITAETETEDLDAMLTGIQSKVAELGGYIEQQTIRDPGTNRYCNITVRVPSQQLDLFVTHLSDHSNVTYYQESANDITSQYVDTESRVNALKAERDRLMELMAKAENMSDLLAIEARLTEVLTYLEQTVSQLRTYDNLVDYATVNLSVSQVEVFTVVQEQSIWQRIGDGFVGNLGSIGNGILEFFVQFVIGIPYLAVLAGIAFGVIAIYKKTAKKKKAKQNPEQA